MAVKSFDPATGITTFDDGSTYQAPHNYGTASNPSWALNDAQQTSMFGDQGAAVNAALGRTDQAIPAWQQGGGTVSGSNALQPVSGGGPVFGGSAGTGGSGGGGTSGTGYGAQNPYLLPMMQSITDQVTSNFNRNVMPQISQQMMATGGYGGSRQGVIEANAMRDMNQGLSNSLANLGLQDFNAQRGYDLGLRGNDLGYAGLDAQIAQNNFGNRLAGANFGLNLFNQGMANNQTGINAGTNIQNTPMNYWSQFANQYNGIGQGYGSTTGSTSQQGNPVLGALGGAQLGSRLGSMWGGSPNAAGGANAQGWGSGAGFGNQDLGLNF